MPIADAGLAKSGRLKFKEQELDGSLRYDDFGPTGSGQSEGLGKTDRAPAKRAPTDGA